MWFLFFWWIVWLPSSESNDIGKKLSFYMVWSLCCCELVWRCCVERLIYIAVSFGLLVGKGFHCKVLGQTWVMLGNEFPHGTPGTW